MAFTIITPIVAGIMPITNTDAGYTPTNGSSAVPSSPMAAGMIVQANDPTYGNAEFILLKGCASTVVGSLVRYNAVDFSTTLVVNTAVQDVPVAVAMSANTSTTAWGWYQISGTATLAKISTAGGTVAANAPVYLSATAGKVWGTASAGKQVVACRSQVLASLSAATTVLVTINRPHLQSQVT